jgi:hypothetical protein
MMKSHSSTWDVKDMVGARKGVLVLCLVVGE